jgi:hypothetical protein
MMANCCAMNVCQTITDGHGSVFAFMALPRYSHVGWVSFAEPNIDSNSPFYDKSNMIETIEHLTNEEIQERYVKRIKTFFSQIKEWLPDELEMNDPIPNRDITDTTGTYQTGMVSIYKKGVPEPDNFVADIIPLGATTLLGEGILEIFGAWGEEKLIYFCRDTLPQVEYKPGKFRPIYRGVDSDGWYWLESSMSNRAIFVAREQLFDLIRMVSFYEFD